MAGGLLSAGTKIDAIHTSSAPYQLEREESRPTPLPLVALSKLAFAGLARGHSTLEPRSHHLQSHLGRTNTASELETH